MIPILTVTRADREATACTLIGVKAYPDVDAYIQQSDQWPEAMTALRPILLGCGLTEEIKWGKPCYSHDGKNIVILQEMKEFLALMFFKGALLNDPASVLEEQGRTRGRLVVFGSPRSRMWTGWLTA